MMAHSRILEVTLLSAEDLLEVYKTMKTYAIVWVQPDRKLATGIDQTGGTHPAWNDKFSFLRRPSGRPQGILNMEVSLVDSTMRSLPLLEEPIPKPTENDHHEDDESQNDKLNVNVNAKMTRSQSDRTELKMEDNSMERPVKGSTINGGFDASELDDKCNGSMVNGGSVCSTDVGPSASVVAAAIAHGLYKPPVNNQVQTKENLRIKEWTRKEREEEELEMKIERWEPKIPPAATVSRKSIRGKKGKGGSTKLFSCFSNSFGIEISITCGGNEAQGGINGNGSNYKVYHLSDADDDYSQSIV
ncbi:hypothetical protein Godav_028084 [Gossypium davidsonii]|uniref:C2 domain-containing protein n=1 Tax=Gossypium davidsonii TaxID=34287 RepID=A0A7J8RZN9_GOSDV|nr:hypothetical protein [Gossypium davidsonii]